MTRARAIAWAALLGCSAFVLALIHAGVLP